MAIKRKITAQPIPDVDASPDYKDQDRVFDALAPEGVGWKLENSFRGEYNIFHVWKKGDINYDDGMENYWTSKGDDLINGTVGDGQKFSISMGTGETTKSVEGSFLPYESFIYGGTIFWEGDSNKKTVTLDVVATAASLTTGDSVIVESGTNKVVPKSDNSGTNALDGIPTLVDSKTSTGWWDFIDNELVPNFNMEGSFDIYTVDKTVARLLNDFDLMPKVSGESCIKADNAWKVFPGYKFKLIANNIEDGNWDVSLVFHMIKRKTVSY